ncbi:MAG: LD-carboxypeptidase, partial [Cyanobacteria bacterium J06639_1]
MSLILPPRLQPGDRARVVLTSGPCDRETLQAGIDIWRAWGLKVEIDIPDRPCELEYLAGSDRDRLNTLQAALDDPTCRTILCGRGGYGVTRLLGDLNWDRFRKSPKWIVGFSDITALLWAAANQGVGGLHAPLLSTLPHESEGVRSRLWQWLHAGAGYELSGTAWNSGRVEGTLFPANLAVATSLFATPDWPLPYPDTILAFEDINEDDYRIDRLLTQWRNAGAFESVAGIALGRFSWNDPLPEDERYDATLALRDRLMDLKIPI